MYTAALEELKSSYDYFYNIDKSNPSFTLLKGNINGVMFSCPHAVSQLREGKEKLADIHTGPLGKALNKLGYTVLIKTNNLNDDANYDLKSDYKDFLVKYIKKNNIKFLIDLHGMSKKRNVSICLGTGFGKSFNGKAELSSLLITAFNRAGLDSSTLAVDFPFHASERTVSRYVNKKAKIESIQIEINSNIFSDDKQIISLLTALDNFCKILTKLNSLNANKINHKQIIDLEKDFNFENCSPFSFDNKNSKIIITAPHSSSMIREGIESDNEVTSGVLAKLLGENLNISYITKKAKTTYNSNDEYVEFVKSVTPTHPCSCIVELHIMSEKRKHALSICTNEGSSLGVRQDIIYNIVNILSKNKYTNFFLDYPFNNKNSSATINKVFASTGIPSLKLVVNFNSLKGAKLKPLYTALEEIVFFLNALN